MKTAVLSIPECFETATFFYKLCDVICFEAQAPLFDPNCVNTLLRRPIRP